MLNLVIENNNRNAGRAALRKQCINERICSRFGLHHAIVLVHTVGIVNNQHNVRCCFEVFALNAEGNFPEILRAFNCGGVFVELYGALRRPNGLRAARCFAFRRNGGER